MSARKAQLGRPFGCTRQEHQLTVAAIGEAALGSQSRWQDSAQALIQIPDTARFGNERSQAGHVLEGFTKRGIAGHCESRVLRTGEGDEGLESMNIILVGGPNSGSRQFNLACTRTRWLCASAALIVLGAIVSLGFMAGRGFGNVDGLSANDVETLRAQLIAQKAQLDQTEAQSRRDLDALAIQLGELQAQATRLNALGQRLTRMGKLDDGEFDFAKAPSIGGPESHAPIDDDYFAPEFSDTLVRLRAQFDTQAEQLGVLETLLLDRDLDAEFMPSGMPVRSGFMASQFGMRIDPFNGTRAFHSGIDFDGVKGADVLTVASGVVVFAGRHPSYGNMIDIDHGNGYTTRYAHNDKNLVKVGDVVTGGQLIAKMGATGRATGSHVHFEVWQDGKPINPKKFVSAIR